MLCVISLIRLSLARMLMVPMLFNVFAGRFSQAGEGGEGEDLEARGVGEPAGEGMELGDEGKVGLLVGKIFPPMSDEDSEGLGKDDVLDFFEHGLAGAMVGEETAGMGEEEAAVGAPVGGAGESFAEAFASGQPVRKRTDYRHAISKGIIEPNVGTKPI